MKLYAKVKAKAKENRVEKLDDSHYKVWVKTAPEKGKANEAVVDILSRHFDVPRSQIAIVSGRTSNQKIIQISENACGCR